MERQSQNKCLYNLEKKATAYRHVSVGIHIKNPCLTSLCSITLKVSTFNSKARDSHKTLLCTQREREGGRDGKFCMQKLHSGIKGRREVSKSLAGQSKGGVESTQSAEGRWWSGGANWFSLSEEFGVLHLYVSRLAKMVS